MNAVDLRNGVAVVIAGGLATLLAANVGGLISGAPARPSAAADVVALATHTLRDHAVFQHAGETWVEDAHGVAVPVHSDQRPYQRIASLGMVSDSVVLDWCDPSRVVAFSSYSIGRDRQRIADRPRLDGLTSIEAVLAHTPDLVLLSGGAADIDKVQRLREHGIQVFDLGAAYGLPAVADDLRALGLLLGHPNEGEHLAWSLQHRLATCTAGLPPNRPQRRAVVLHCYADQFYGGTRARDGRTSSYHEVITAAGLTDAVANRFDQPWPQIPSELVVELAPDLIITRLGQAQTLRNHPALKTFTGQIIEMPAELWDHPGPPMAEAAEVLVRKVWGST